MAGDEEGPAPQWHAWVTVSVVVAMLLCFVREVRVLRCEEADRGPYFIVVMERAARGCRGGRERDHITGKLLQISALPEMGGRVDCKSNHP